MFLRHYVNLLTILPIGTGKENGCLILLQMILCWARIYCIHVERKHLISCLFSYLSTSTTQIFLALHTGVRLWHQKWHSPQNFMTVRYSSFCFDDIWKRCRKVFSWGLSGLRLWVVLFQGWALDLKWERDSLKYGAQGSSPSCPGVRALE